MVFIKRMQESVPETTIKRFMNDLLFRFEMASKTAMLDSPGECIKYDCCIPIVIFFDLSTLVFISSSCLFTYVSIP